MSRSRHKTLFDPQDHELLEAVNPVLRGQKAPHLLRNLYEPHLHPRGIKELGASRALRIAGAMFDLVHALERGAPAERLRALRSVRDEVLHNGSQSLPRNTARVLLQLMKELVRCVGDEERQLRLAHDFAQATSGRPRLIRKLLTRYRLLEMPEDWSQMAFDHHVHDANSKGRKSPTHLIMDAWIKGIRTLGVIYYNFVRADAAAEALEAAEIMGVSLRIGVELTAAMHGKRVQLIWAPRGFRSGRDFLDFLERPEMQKLLVEGRALAEYKTRVLLAVLRRFVEEHAPRLQADYGVEVPALDEAGFLAFVGPGQPSLLHLAEYIHGACLAGMQARAKELRDQGSEQELATLDRLVPDLIYDRYLAADYHRLNTTDPPDDEPRPPLFDLGVDELLAKLEQAPRGSRVILNPSNLGGDEVLEVLYEGRGRITHLEIFNAKDWAEGQIEHRQAIAEIRLALNNGDILALKQLVLEQIRAVERSERPDREERANKLRAILRDIPAFQQNYRHSRLKSRLGSDSTGRSRHSPGMGLVAIQSLPATARRRAIAERRLFAVWTSPQLHITWTKKRSERPSVDKLYGWLRRVPGVRALGYHRSKRWGPEPNSTRLVAPGNIASLGGVPEDTGNSFRAPPRKAAPTPRLAYLNTPTKNLLKVGVGFVPAFLTFYLTKDWWLLAWFGALIWFSITGLRNIVQSVLGGGGFVRSPLLKWNDFISWGRVADSLLFTGFSVPLLDYLVKTLLLARGLNITTETNPLALYTLIALANGTYLFSHNVFRGLPFAAAVGNFFRTVLSIPLAVGLSWGVAQVLGLTGTPAALIPAMLQPWAAVISKTASDVVAGVIEGLADRARNLGLRSVDYHDKREQLQQLQGQLEMAFPEEDVISLLGDPKAFVGELKEKRAELFRVLAIDALDQMYFWMYQPRGRYQFRRLLRRASAQERRIYFATQRVLERKRELSELLIAGLVGKRFDKALAFYLSRVDGYLAQLEAEKRRLAS